MRPIERTGDPTIDLLAELVERYRGKVVQDNPHNQLSTKPRIVFMGLTHMSFPTTHVWASGKTLTDDALMNPRVKDNFAFAEVRIGTGSGTGVGYRSEFAPIENGPKSLEPILELCIQNARRDSYKDYYDLLKESGLVHEPFSHKLATVNTVRHLGQSVEKRIPVRLLQSLAHQSVEILKAVSDDARVRISIHDETRRYVNSQGTIVRDSFWGYHFKFISNTLDKKNNDLKFTQSLYFTRRDELRGEKILSFVRNMAREIEKRKDCPKIDSGVYTLLLSPSAMESHLHECFVHFLASDSILREGSTIWGWENFGKRVANPHLSVYADPGIPERWGSMPYDYEGVPAERRTLIERGVIKGYLADRDGAYLLSERTGATIHPGDARFQIKSGNTAFNPQPRVSNMVIEWHGRKSSWSRLKKRFEQELARSGKYGLYIPDSSEADSDVESGEISVTPNFPYLVTPAGDYIPVSTAVVRDHAPRFVNNIVAMDSQQRYCAHRCGDEETMALVRAGIVCGGGIVRDVFVQYDRPVKRRL